ncbi:hypothetical protein ANN_15327 [Periplaneta americana]|uniref:Uncharacterized protein n=1 Tax=Periplaneta americana TaxID=6978 RepID=A0ABQ8SGZ8_PERAM|nr:hypothetical protein ANN_15327 [Periplaneta americana]
MELHALYTSPDIIRNIKSRRLRWAGHVTRMGEFRNAYRELVGRPEGKRPLWRPRRRWEYNIKMDLREVGYDGRDWINLAQDRDQWRAYVRAAMNLRSAAEICHVRDALSRWYTSSQTTHPPAYPEFQKQWDVIFSPKILDKLLSSFKSEQDLARLLALQESEFRPLLLALPSPYISTLIDTSFKIAMALRLDCKLCQPHQCICGGIADIDGHHALSCARSKGRIPRHRLLHYRSINRKPFYGLHVVPPTSIQKYKGTYRGNSYDVKKLHAANRCSIVSASIVSPPDRLVPVVDLMLAGLVPAASKSSPGSKQSPTPEEH